MLVETDAVVAEAVHFLPGLEMFGVGADGDVGLEVTVRKRIGEFAADLEMVKLFAVCEQIEDENFHGVLPWESGALLGGGIRGAGYGQSRRPANRRQKIPHMWNGGASHAGRTRSSWRRQFFSDCRHFPDICARCL